MKDSWPILYQYVVPAVLGLAGGVVGSLIAPWVQWAIEKSRDRQRYRRELIQRWRQAIDENIAVGRDIWSVDRFSQTADYAMMRRYLSSESQKWIDTSIQERRKWYRDAGIDVWIEVVKVRRRNFLGELATLEKKWGLV